MSWTDSLVLWVHLLMAIFLIGGSLFFWLILIPQSYSLTGDEIQRS